MNKCYLAKWKHKAKIVVNATDTNLLIPGTSYILFVEKSDHPNISCHVGIFDEQGHHIGNLQYPKDTNPSVDWRKIRNVSDI